VALALPTKAMAAPSPSPGLETLLADPPASDFQEDPSPMAIHGQFDAHRYVQFLGPQNAPTTESTLRGDGFVLGFSRAWVQPASNHILLELVIAFAGRNGAKKWLDKSEQVDKSDTYYQKAIPMSGLDTYYGAHFADPTTALYVDVVSFVKGNDFFLVGLVSRADDLGDTAPRQTRRQFDTAPDYTIPPSEWPEAAGSIMVGPLLVPSWLLYAVGGTLALMLLVALGAVLLLRRRRSSGGLVLAAGPLMSADGHYWWDGQAWRLASEEAPPDALRSEDGAYWWDGSKWRLIEPRPGPAS
jgi:hypothetical protein